MKTKMLRLTIVILTIAIIIMIVTPVSAAVSTDQTDYAPGSVVTISGDNSDGAGYLPGETVHVDVSGPNGYQASFDAEADGYGAWLGTVTLASDESAVGSYAYTATGLTSEATQSGTFTDGPTAPTLLSPNNGVNIATADVDLSWSSGLLSGAAAWEVRVGITNPPTSPIWDSGTIITSTISSGRLNINATAPALANGTYYWQVRAWGTTSMDWGNWSSTRSFAVNALLPPTLNSPVNGSTTDDNTPTLSWNPVTAPIAAVAYEAVLFNRYDIQIYNIVGAWTTSTQATVDVDILGTDLSYLTDATYHWKVRAKDSLGNVSAWSDWSYFVVETGDRQFTATITPTASDSGQTQDYTVTIKNTADGLYGIGSAIIDIPTGWSVSDAEILNDPLNLWSVSIDGTSGELKLNTSLGQFVTGISISVTFTATAPTPTATTDYTWTTSAYDETNYTEAFTIQGSQPQVTVQVNTAPTVGEITVAPAMVEVNSSVTASAHFTDPDEGDTHTATWDWGDETTLEETIDGESGTVEDSHSYDAAGVYSVTLTVKDGSDAQDESTYQYVVVYDTNGGFVTGGGWIDSPEEAYAADPDLTGKATFGFVSKYLKGADVPTGNTEFQFHAGDLNFSSTSYQWLVVNQNGTNAQFKGTGTINGMGEYKFQIWAGDGTGDEGADTFHIKIWTEDEAGVETVVYDNGVDQPIGDGSIVVHTSKK